MLLLREVATIFGMHESYDANRAKLKVKKLFSDIQNTVCQMQ